VGAWWIGPRIEEDLDDATPNNILLMLVGAGILWIGWNGFNGGDPYSASPDAGAAVLNTNLCTAFSSLVWVVMDLIYYRRPSVIGAIQGMITGLVSTTKELSDVSIDHIRLPLLPLPVLLLDGVPLPLASDRASFLG
jgi:ammonium transporter, Amt family